MRAPNIRAPECWAIWAITYISMYLIHRIGYIASDTMHRIQCIVWALWYQATGHVSHLILSVGLCENRNTSQYEQAHHTPSHLDTMRWIMRATWTLRNMNERNPILLGIRVYRVSSCLVSRVSHNQMQCVGWLDIYCARSRFQVSHITIFDVPKCLDILCRLYCSHNRMSNTAVAKRSHVQVVHMIERPPCLDMYCECSYRTFLSIPLLDIHYAHMSRWMVAKCPHVPLNGSQVLTCPVVGWLGAHISRWMVAKCPHNRLMGIHDAHISRFWDIHYAHIARWMVAKCPHIPLLDIHYAHISRCWISIMLTCPVAGYPLCSHVPLLDIYYARITPWMVAKCPHIPLLDIHDAHMFRW